MKVKEAFQKFSQIRVADTVATVLFDVLELMHWTALSRQKKKLNPIVMGAEPDQRHEKIVAVLLLLILWAQQLVKSPISRKARDGNLLASDFRWHHNLT